MPPLQCFARGLSSSTSLSVVHPGTTTSASSMASMISVSSPSPSPSNDAAVVSVFDNRVWTGRRRVPQSKKDVFSTAPIPIRRPTPRRSTTNTASVKSRTNVNSRKDEDNCENEDPAFAIFSERDVIEGTNPLFEFNNYDYQHQQQQQPAQTGQPGTFTDSFFVQEENVMHDWMDLFTGLCVCHPSRCRKVVEETSKSDSNSDACSGPSSIRPRQHGPAGDMGNKSSNLQRRILYPIARYPGARLNSPFLVEQRRKSLEKHLTFKPVQMAASTSSKQ